MPDKKRHILGMTSDQQIAHQDPFLLRLPVELIAEIVSYLDCHTIKFLLLALEGLRKYAIVSKPKDTPYQKKPVLFDIPGVEVRDVREPGEVLQLRRSPFLIKLVETWGYSFHTRLIYANVEKFDNLTFVYHVHDLTMLRSVLKEQISTTNPMNGPKFSGSQMRLYTTQELNYSKWEHTRYYLSRIMVKTAYCINPKVFDKLKSFSITCDNSNVVRNIYMPNVERFALHFFKRRGIPILENLWAPNLLNLSITYSDRMPLIKGIHIMERPKHLSQNTFFELCHIGAFNIHAPPIIENRLNHYHYQTMDMSFTEHFDSVMIVGAHELVFRAMDLSNLKRLKWLKTVKYTNTCLDLRRSESIDVNDSFSDFIFHTNVVDSFIPSFTFRLLTKVQVFTTARGLKLNGLLSRTNVICNERNFCNFLTDVRICCYLPKEEVGGDGHIVLGEEDLLAFGDSRLLHVMELDGCYLGENNKFIKLAVHLGFLDNTMCDDANIRLSLVRPQSEIQEAGPDYVDNVLRIPYLFHGIDTQFDGIEIGQVQGSKTYVGWTSLKFDFISEYQANGFHIIADCTFDDVTVNGIKATMEDCVNYSVVPTIFGDRHRWIKQDHRARVIL